MFRNLVLLFALIMCSPVNAQIEKEMACSTAAIEAMQKLSDLNTHLSDVSAPTMDLNAGKLDDKVVRQICSAAQDTIAQANSIKSAVSALKGCSTTSARKMADITIDGAKSLIHDVKCH